MKRVLFLTNYPSPYRVHFFDELGKSLDVTVLYSDQVADITHRDPKWFEAGEGGFHSVQLRKTAAFRDENLCLDVLPWLKKPFDYIVICGYASPTAMLAMAWLRLHRVPFYMEVDGGLIREDSAAKYRFKRLLVSGATYWLSSGPRTTAYLVHYGAREEAVRTYPFTSLWERDILPQIPTMEEKQSLRRELGMMESRIVLYVGRFTRAKGMDALLEAATTLDADTGVYFVGGEPEKAHLRFCESQGLSNVHFVGFRRKEQLTDYYKAADLLVLPTESDVWGLVINEAMACGLPVVTTNRCVAGLELVEDGINGYLVPVNDREALAEKLRLVLSADYREMGERSLEKIRPYTLENMAKSHVEIFENEG